MKMKTYQAIVSYTEEHMHQAGCLEGLAKEFPKYWGQSKFLAINILLPCRIPGGTLSSILSQRYQVACSWYACVVGDLVFLSTEPH